MDRLAIVITAYNRAEPLAQLLKSLNGIITDRNDITLIVSIDNKGTEKVNQIANEFKWRFGEKKIIVHQDKLGLRSHFIWAGDQSLLYDNVLFLEDDLYVSPFVLDFVFAVINRYSEDQNIAGGSLYNPSICEFDKCKFYQVEDGFDNYFFAHPYWGNIWMKESWKRFKTWFSNYKCDNDILPNRVRTWNDTSFKKVFIQYLIETHRYMVYPRISYITNMGVKGLHSSRGQGQYQVPLQLQSKQLRLSNFEDSLAIYDAYFEIEPCCIKKVVPDLENYDFDVDLRLSKEQYKCEYVLTRRPVSQGIFEFGEHLKPFENNIILKQDGIGISFALSNEVKNEKRSRYAITAEDIIRFQYPIGIHESIECLKAAIKNKLDRNLDR